MRYDVDPFPYVECLPLFDVFPNGMRFVVATHANGPIEILSLICGEVQQVIRAKELSNLTVWILGGEQRQNHSGRARQRDSFHPATS
jgi:hypothetical protein